MKNNSLIENFKKLFPHLTESDIRKTIIEADTAMWQEAQGRKWHYGLDNRRG